MEDQNFFENNSSIKEILIDRLKLGVVKVYLRKTGSQDERLVRLTLEEQFLPRTEDRPGKIKECEHGKNTVQAYNIDINSYQSIRLNKITRII